MLRRLSLLVAFATASVITFGQGQGTIQGKIKDKTSGELLPFVNVIIEQNGVQKGGTSSDMDGEYKLASISPGTYTIKASFVGYKPMQINGVIISSNKITFYDIEMVSEDVTLEEFVVVDYAVPLIDKDGGASGATVTRDDIAKMPGRSATAIASTVGGVYSQEGSGALSIRGSRSDASYYFIDGIKVRGSTGLPKSAIEEVSVITGGLPANYGDATGGVISITTRGASKEYFGGIDYLTSGYRFGEKTVGLDRYAFNLIEGSFSGPLIMKKDSTGKKVKPILGFFVSANYTDQVDGRPFAIDQYRVKGEVRDELVANPLRPTGTGVGVFYNTSYLTQNDFEKVNYRMNAQSKTFTGAGKIDVNAGPLINLTFGGSMDYGHYNNYDFNNSLFNYQNNGITDELTWRVYGRFTQRFNSGKESSESSSSLIKNAYYTVMVDYSKYNAKSQDPRHKDKIFNYGYVGQFITYRQKSYEPVDKNGTTVLEHNGYQDTLVTFNAAPDFDGDGNAEAVNPDLAAITSQYYNLYDDPEDHYENMTQILSANALRNGDQPQSVYNLWNNIGTTYNGYSVTDNTQFRITASGNADIGNHAVSIGFEYEQRDDRGFSVSPVGLWTLARQLTGNHNAGHLQELDTANAIITYFGTLPIYDYNPLNASPGAYDASDDIESQSFFDFNLRNLVGYDPDGLDFIDIDAVDPSILTLDMFSANELLNQGNNYVSYFGYDYNGAKTKDKPSFNDFFTARDEYGNKTRPIAPYQPIYIAGYIMDKFAFDDLIFNVGVRVDRFDANQPVLKDGFVLYEAKTVGEVEASTICVGCEHPDNMGDDYVVYVDNVESPTTINGYRDGRNWYNAEGTAITDPSIIYGPSGVAPLLVNPNAPDDKDQEMIKGFTDYKPQINVMPRVAFSFPISDEALFFAHYDVLTKRPTTGNRLDIMDYYFMDVRNVVVNNPDLKPEKTIDYELGFQQVLTKSSSLKISAFYRELRNQVALFSMTGAYPRTYRTYTNLDFGTVKGLTISYDLRRTGNLTLRAAYTLQFAEGTGSNANSAVNLVNSGLPNLRTIYPYDYDQRHAFVTVIDYRYGEGKDYNGPKLFGKDIFANTGVNIVSNFGSGTPYSASQYVTPQALLSGGASGSLEGQINGSRKPATFRMDLQADKNITLKFGKDAEDKPKTANLNIYLQVSNVLNNINVLGVYGATGNPNDDGYLADARYQAAIASTNSEQSYRDYYALKVNSPWNYGIPRTIRLGLKFDF
ncbi:MAG: carboxypeptidase-like regulatory domain-containing protein [Bacteroidota bacterium]